MVKRQILISATRDWKLWRAIIAYIMKRWHMNDNDDQKKKKNSSLCVIYMRIDSLVRSLRIARIMKIKMKNLFLLTITGLFFNIIII